ncbi:MAG: SUMF1/EgtB/PvdO family nonheme iron enzyme [Polyangiaceae bacterium]
MNRRTRVARFLAVVAAIAAVSVGVSSARGDEPQESDDDPYADPPAPAPTEKIKPMAPSRKVVEKDGMVRLPGGAFTVGSNDPKAPSNERPSHAVSVAPFWIDRTEVTVAAYRTCVVDRFCVVPTAISASCTYSAGDPNLPVSCVRWKEADTYCRAVGKRLPSELEWEFAARGTEPVRYPWGGWSSSCAHAVTLKSDGTFRSCGGERPLPVGSKALGATPFGVFDLAGNVEEWVADFYTEQRSAVPSPAVGASHVLRGGGWLSTPSTSRTTSRNWGSALEAGPNVGFRCARGV